jgi:hypothetical protein
VVPVAGFDDATWQALGLVLTLLGSGLSVLAWRRRGAASGLRGFAWSLLPLAAALTGTLQLLWRIADEVVTWAMRLVFSPVVWLGIVLAGVSLVLFVVSGMLRARRPAKQTRPVRGQGDKPALGRSGATAARAPGPDDDLEDIEAILRKHGIS